MSAELRERFAGIQKIRKVLLALVWVWIVLMTLILALDIFDYNLIQSIKNLSFSSKDEMIQAAKASYRNQMIRIFVQAAVFVVMAVFRFIWIFKSNNLARALGSNGMKDTAAWSVVWFFIPIANLFKPYATLREIYLATIDPKNFDARKKLKHQPKSLNVLKLWWFLTLVGVFLEQVGLQYPLANTIDYWATLNSLSIASDCSSIVTSLLMIWLVHEFSARQQASFNAHGDGANVELGPRPVIAEPAAAPLS